MKKIALALAMAGLAACGSPSETSLNGAPDYGDDGWDSIHCKAAESDTRFTDLLVVREGDRLLGSIYLERSVILDRLNVSTRQITGRSGEPLLSVQGRSGGGRFDLLVELPAKPVVGAELTAHLSATVADIDIEGADVICSFEVRANP